MSSTISATVMTPHRASQRSEPTWELAFLFPAQGEWTESAYLALDTNRLVELVDGCLEVLPMPTLFHQAIVRFLFELLNGFVHAHATGEVFFAPLRIRLFAGQIREPDVAYLSLARTRNRHEPPQGAD